MRIINRNDTSTETKHNIEKSQMIESWKWKEYPAQNVTTQNAGEMLSFVINVIYNTIW